MHGGKLLAVALLLVSVGCGDDAETGGGAPDASVAKPAAAPLPGTACTPIEYEGEGRAEYLIASDFPLLGPSGVGTRQVVNAIRYELRRRGWKAGVYHVGLQSCDDSLAATGAWDAAKCRANAMAYAANPSVLGVVGTFNSGCAAQEIPILNQAPGGPVAMVSPTNTLVCLTQNAPGCAADEPTRYYPNPHRNFVRVVAHDGYQGAAMAEYATTLGVKKVFILDDGDAYGQGIAATFKNAAVFKGIQVAGGESWDPAATSYDALMKRVQAAGVDAVFLAGAIDANGGQLIRDKVAVLGANSGAVKLLAPDGFAGQFTIDEAGEAAAGMYISVAGVPLDSLSGKAAEFLEAFKRDYLGVEPADPYAPYGLGAAQVLLDAIAASNGTRADIVAKMLQTHVTDGVLGSFTFNASGDPQDASGAVIGFTIYRATTVLVTETSLSPKQETVTAAMGTGGGG
jgi:branched-chain amino acid transport system substrate-binding protein